MRMAAMPRDLRLTLALRSYRLAISHLRAAINSGDGRLKSMRRGWWFTLFHQRTGRDQGCSGLGSVFVFQALRQVAPIAAAANAISKLLANGNGRRLDLLIA